MLKVTICLASRTVLSVVHYKVRCACPNQLFRSKPYIRVSHTITRHAQHRMSWTVFEVETGSETATDARGGMPANRDTVHTLHKSQVFRHSHPRGESMRVVLNDPFCRVSPCISKEAQALAVYVLAAL